MKQFVLGVFYTEYWDIIKEQTNSYDYFDFDRGLLPIKPKWTGKGIGIDMIDPLIPVIDVFNFLLDDIYLPLEIRKSMTCRELNFILGNKNALDKTQFWLKGNKIETNKILSIIQSVKDSQLTFNNIDLNSFI